MTFQAERMHGARRPYKMTALRLTSKPPQGGKPTTMWWETDKQESAHDTRPTYNMHTPREQRILGIHYKALDITQSKTLKWEFKLVQNKVK